MRLIISLLAVAIMAAPAAAQDEGLTGYWKFNILQDSQLTPFWLVNLDKNKDNRLTVTTESYKGAPRAKVTEAKLTGDTLIIKFQITINTPTGPQQGSLEFEGKLPKPGAKKMFGSLAVETNMFPCVLEATTAKTIFEVDRDLVQRTPNDPRAFLSIFEVIHRAKDNKVDSKELQTWVDSSLKASEMYGPRFALKHQTRLLTVLQSQKTYAEVGAETARKVSKLVDAKMPLDTQSFVLTMAANLLRAGDAKKEADALDARLDKLENEAIAEYKSSKTPPLNFKTEKFAGRKMRSNRAVLVELFTGAQPTDCVAANMAFDGVEKTYGPGDVVLLQYHVPIRLPEPLSNLDAHDRWEYYADAYPKKIRGTPVNLFNGKVEGKGGGDREEAPDKYKEFCEVINKLLETPDTLKLSASAVRTGEKIAITAKVQNLDKPGDKVRLRIALVEDWVRYKGSNGLQYHHRVVRAFAGGAEGTVLKAKDFDHKATIDLADVRAALNKYLSDGFPDGPRPMRFRNLSVVAFVQNDETTEVLQAVNVPVADEK
jgi:hypothetical protein